MGFGLGEPLVGVFGLLDEGVRGDFRFGLRAHVAAQGLHEASVGFLRVQAGIGKYLQGGFGGFLEPLFEVRYDLAAGLAEFTQRLPGDVLPFREVPEARGHHGEVLLQGEGPLLGEVFLGALGEPFQQLAVPFLGKVVKQAVHAFGH